MSHLDKEAIRRIARLENDYTGAMKRLEEYYGDQSKVIRDCMDEVNGFSKVGANDYKNLVLLKSCIEVNYARLKSCDLENEISNTQTMRAIESKLPPLEQREWTEYLQELPRDRQRKSFPEFLQWLEKKGNVWSAMEAKGLSKPRGSSSSKSHTMYSGGGEYRFRGQCHFCNEEGHKKAECPNVEPAGGSRRKNVGGGNRRPNQIGKFSCALCMDDNKWCETWKCEELRKMDYMSRK